MQAGAERHLGIRAGISGFVVQEDQSLPARIAQAFLRLNAGAGDRLTLLRKCYPPSAFSSGIRFNLPDARPGLRLRSMLRRVPGFRSLMRLWSGVRKVLRYLYAAMRLIWRILAAVGRGLHPVIACAGRLRLLHALVKHCWDDAHCLPRPLITQKRWWLRYIISLPGAVLMVAVGVYCAVPTSQTHSADAPPLTLSLEDAEPDIDIPRTEESRSAPPDEAAMIEPPPPPVPDAPWLPVNRAFPGFNLQNPESEGMEFAYSVFSRGRYARRESMAWLAAPRHPEGVRGGRIHLTLERFEERIPPLPDFDTDLTTRLTREQLTMERMAPKASLVTKFGETEVADAVLGTQQGQAGCLLFRYHDAIGFTLAGWFCGSPRKPVDRVSFTCFIDRLDLVQAGQDHPLRQLFAAAERNRIHSLHSCGSMRQPGRRMTWLDHEAPMPDLKLSTRHADKGHK